MMTTIYKRRQPDNSYSKYNMQERYTAIEDAQGNRVMTPYVSISGYAGGTLNGSAIRNAEQSGYGDVLMPFSFNVLESLD